MTAYSFAVGPIPPFKKKETPPSAKKDSICIVLDDDDDSDSQDGEREEEEDDVEKELEGLRIAKTVKLGEQSDRGKKRGPAKMKGSLSAESSPTKKSKMMAFGREVQPFSHEENAIIVAQ
ncbi:hypothetical protein CBS101457_002871 [Exobasidium rhododendri]|nr:hypothetical protein CBS101457_002871 [Exobasidium rhododendri]